MSGVFDDRRTNGSRAKVRSARYPELDSLRGIAAAVVLAHHVMLLSPTFQRLTASNIPSAEDGSALARIATFSPVHVLWAGHEAVLFFFVLSGFVLALPFVQGRADPYRSFVVKRVCRIYPVYLFAVAFAVAARLAFASNLPADASDWTRSSWSQPLGWRLILDHALLVGTFDNGQLDPVLWSLVHEMRISLVFPAIAWCTLRFRSFAVAAGMGVLGAAGWLAGHLCLRHGVHTDLFATAQYSFQFAVGAVLAKHHAALSSLARRLQAWTRYGLAVVALLLFGCAWWPPHRHLGFLSDAVATVGCGIIIVLGSAGLPECAWLRGRFVHHLGKVSYSFYLLHAVVILALVRVFPSGVPHTIVGVAAFAISYGLASLTFRWIEAPTMDVGRRLARRIAVPATAGQEA